MQIIPLLLLFFSFFSNPSAVRIHHAQHSVSSYTKNLLCKFTVMQSVYTCLCKCVWVCVPTPPLQVRCFFVPIDVGRLQCVFSGWLASKHHPSLPATSLEWMHASSWEEEHDVALAPPHLLLLEYKCFIFIKPPSFSARSLPILSKKTKEGFCMGLRISRRRWRRRSLGIDGRFFKTFLVCWSSVHDVR